MASVPTKDGLLQIRLTGREKEQLGELAGQAGRSMSDYVRWFIGREHATIASPGWGLDNMDAPHEAWTVEGEVEGDSAAEELPDPPRLCERCLEPLPPDAHHLRKYHEGCNVAKAASEPQPCKICTEVNARNGNKICAHCHGLRHNTIYLFRMFATHRLERAYATAPMTDRDLLEKFRGWVLGDLNLQPTFTKLHASQGGLVPDVHEALDPYKMTHDEGDGYEDGRTRYAAVVKKLARTAKSPRPSAWMIGGSVVCQAAAGISAIWKPSAPAMASK